MKDKENLSFEETVKKLESILEAMNRGSLTLEASLKNFEEAHHLLKRCYTMLNEAEKKVEILIKKDGELHPEPLES